MTVTYLVGDVFDRLAEIPDQTVDLVVTSPPFLALRSYLPEDHPDKSREIGSEANPAEFLNVMLNVTSELRRVLAPHGSIAIELGDTYSGSGGAGGDYLEGGQRDGQESFTGAGRRDKTGWPLSKSKALIPELYRVALAYGINPLTGADSPAGRWLVRNVVTWCRPNPAVGALGDKWRPATSDIVVACLSPKRYWDDVATRQPLLGDRETTLSTGAPLLDWWVVSTAGYKGSHYAVMPEKIVAPLVEAACPPGGVVLDPFAGTGTTLAVAAGHGYNAIGIDLDGRNVDLAVERIGGLFMAVKSRGEKYVADIV
ncbi:MAG: site-specific DNA-methyltransferase [Anaerovoracaceae bacterium]